MDGAIRLVLVEDNDIFRESLELLLALHPEVEVVGSVDNGVAAVGLVRNLRPDVVLLDYRLPGMNGLEVTRAIRRFSRDVRVVCLTASVSAREVEELYAAGADACVTKDEHRDEIIAAIQQVAPR